MDGEWDRTRWRVSALKPRGAGRIGSARAPRDGVWRRATLSDEVDF